MNENISTRVDHVNTWLNNKATVSMFCNSRTLIDLKEKRKKKKKRIGKKDRSLLFLFFYFFLRIQTQRSYEIKKQEVTGNPLKQGVLDRQGESPAIPVTRYLILIV